MTNCQWLDEFPEHEGLLEEIQSQGRKYLGENNLPSKENETWRLTNLKRIERILNSTNENHRKNKSSSTNIVYPSEPKEGCRIIIDKSNLDYKNIDLPDGIELIDENNKEYIPGEIIGKFPKLNKWQLALNNASIKNILALKVSGEDVKPIELIINTNNLNLNSTRILVFVDDNTNFDLLQLVLGSEGVTQSHLIEIYLGKNAKLNHGLVCIGQKESSLLAQVFIDQKEHSNYLLTTIQKSWDISRIEPYIMQSKGKAVTNLKGLQISQRDEQISTYTYVHFDGPEGSLEQIQKAAASEKSHSIFNGAIKVPQIAQQTNASQLSRNLLISKNARIDTKPELEIIADDVKCAHGATVSQLQEDELFYLRSRGIKKDQANLLLLKGYCEEVTKDLPVEANRWNILAKLLEEIM